MRSDKKQDRKRPTLTSQVTLIPIAGHIPKYLILESIDVYATDVMLNVVKHLAGILE
ncbi:MAG: hypothetical protein NT027_11295 [Proteobacteria bacterium]|nr:hypothetical protein [Pseudomonadota bacterium]